jgi:hypothetical protein
VVAALSVHTGLLNVRENLAGDGRGTCWTPAQEHGRWEARMKATRTGAPTNVVAQLRPAAAGAQPATEIEFMNLSDPARRSAFARVRPTEGPAPAVGEVSIDAIRWHSCAVELTPTHLTAFVDGRPYFHSAQAPALPPGPKIMCIELERPPTAGNQATQTSILQVDWVRHYPLPPDPLPPNPLPPAASGPVG